jgi:lysophospholipase L1-like esterase
MTAVGAALPRAVFVGDSQLEGLAPHLRDALADQMSIVATAAMPGASTRVIVDAGKITTLVLSQHPDIVVFVLGGNDTAGAASSQATVDAVRQAKAGGARVVWFGPAIAHDPTVEARHAGTRAQQRALVPSLGAEWIDTSPWTDSGWGPDDVHFTSSAYEQQAHAIAQALRGGSAAAVIVGLALGVLAIGGIAALVVHHTRAD